jgi:hypothetical protein
VWFAYIWMVFWVQMALVIEVRKAKLMTGAYQL